MKKTTITFILNIMIILFTLIGTVIMLTKPGDGTGLMSSGVENLKYFTVLSNELCGIVAIMRLFALLKGKPQGFILLKYIAAAAVGLTFLIIVAFLQPMYPNINMFKRANLWFHLIVPVTAMLEFVLLDVGEKGLKFRYTVLAAIPSLVYGFGYLINILVNGVGTWPNTNDWYGFVNWGLPVGIGIFAVVVIMNWAIACLLRFLNRKVQGRLKR